MHSLFSNIGNKIRTLAIIVTVLGFFASLVGWIVLLVEKAILMAFIVLIAGVLASWIGSFLMYGFGEIIIKLTEIAENTSQIKTIKSTRRTKTNLQVQEESALDKEELATKLSETLLIPMEEADIKVRELLSINPDLHPYLNAWLNDSEPLVKFQKITSAMIMEKDKCTYPEALLRMDYLIKHPTAVSNYINENS